jgi:HEXXH motif-containing protein
MNEQWSGGGVGAPVAIFPWHWLPDPAAWFESLIAPLVAWEPDPGLGLNAYSLRLSVAAAIDHRERWLRHPCLNALTLQNRVKERERAFQLAVWIAANSDDDLGSVTLHEAMHLWTPAGGAVIQPGTHSLRALGAQVREAHCPVAIPLDAWCWSVGYPIRDSWAAASGEGPEEDATLAHEIAAYCRAIERIRQCLPDILKWILAATAVIVPMRNPGLDVVRSCSQASLPGLVWTDLVGGCSQILETVVHETAHNHLYTAEAEAPLVNHDHQGRYASPLRPEPRPLRGIMLACHALAYMTAAFVDGRRAGYFDRPFPHDAFADLVLRRDHAERTLIENRRHLTGHGSRFLVRTLEVCAYARDAA